MTNKTRDGVEYQEGMTLYVPLYDGEQHSISQFDQGWLEGGKVWFKSKSGKPGTFGPPFEYYALRDSAILYILQILQRQREKLDDKIEKWENELGQPTN